ncbi:ABC transporter ATP-binding protein [Actinokineospora sp. UTMC 2448]|uniref:ABC transporter ATP-binding protein n=1 Tax=Actinokineospora sp. UTMC 2448 TaxID=2268449 RepID=UPI00216447BF|nr:ATP-binding cassette domain-containing protein [Actinokineospora sp. UTMC 2448]UVS77305.1 putative ABC transporter ATP-binding protein YxlF [Actinokineospora sp. UTMC 2448]
MIELRNLTKRYKHTVAVDGVDCTVHSGLVTGFLGPNGAGKSTTMRMILGLDEPTSGTATINGVRYDRIRHPLRTVGALLDARAGHPGRSARAHLTALARATGLPVRTVDAVLDRVGLTDVAGKRAGTFSLGMAQRLGIAAALLGDPAVLILDEPVNGLDVDGVRWIRALLRGLADEGRTVFISSHLMSELELIADRLLVIGRGRLIADASMAEVIARSGAAVLVRTPDPAALHAALAGAGADVRRTGPHELAVTGVSAERVGDIAHATGVRVHGLTTEQASLEQAYLDLTTDSVEFGVTR